MNHRDWQYHQHVLHLHDSAKFTRLTPRESHTPLRRDDQAVANVLIVVFSVLGLVSVFTLLALGLI